MSTKKASAAAVTPPPKRRASKGPRIDKDLLADMWEKMNVKDPESGEYPYITNGEQYETENKVAAQLLRFRKAFVALEYVEDASDLQGTQYAVTRDPETGEKQLDDDGNEIGPFIFAIKLRD